MASLHTRKGPSMIRDEDGLLTGYVYIDPGAEDVSRYRERMSAALALRVEVPEGYTIAWSGQYEAARTPAAAIAADRSADNCDHRAAHSCQYAELG